MPQQKEYSIYRLLFYALSKWEVKMEQQRLTLTVEEVAELLGIGRGLAYQMVRDGRLPVLRFGRRIVVPRRSIDELLALPEHRKNEQN